MCWSFCCIVSVLWWLSPCSHLCLFFFCWLAPSNWQMYQREVWNVVRVLQNGMMDPDTWNRTQLWEWRNQKSIVLSPDLRVKGRAQTNVVKERHSDAKVSYMLNTKVQHCWETPSQPSPVVQTKVGIVRMARTRGGGKKDLQVKQMRVRQQMEKQKNINSPY